MLLSHQNAQGMCVVPSQPALALGRGVALRALSTGIGPFIHMFQEATERKLCIPERIGLPSRASQSFCHMRAGGQWTACGNAANAALEADLRPPCHFIFVLWLILLEGLGC